MKYLLVPKQAITAVFYSGDNPFEIARFVGETVKVQSHNGQLSFDVADGESVTLDVGDYLVSNGDFWTVHTYEDLCASYAAHPLDEADGHSPDCATPANDEADAPETDFAAPANDETLLAQMRDHVLHCTAIYDVGSYPRMILQGLAHQMDKAIDALRRHSAQSPDWGTVDDGSSDRLRALEEEVKRLNDGWQRANQNLFDATMLLGEARARNEKLATALLWCSGASDFQEGGFARTGWVRLVAPLLQS